MSGQWKTNRVTPLPSNWSSTRARIIERDQSTCQVCHRYTARPEVDHIGDRDEHTDDNLRVLCQRCHALRTSSQGVTALRARAARRFRDPERHPGDIT